MARSIIGTYISAYMADNNAVSLPREIFYRVDAFQMPDDYFVRMFRVNKEIALNICTELSSALEGRSRKKSIFNTEIKVLCALRFFACGSYQQSVANDVLIAMSQPSVSRCITQVSDAVVKRLLQKWVKFPTTTEELQRIKTAFYDLSLLPGVIGAIDGTHVLLYGVNQNEYNIQDFVNRKGHFSINVQLICDANLNIMNVNAKYPGATHDSFIWKYSTVRNSFINQTLPSGGSSFLIGDSGYPLEPWLLTPVSNAQLGSPEAAYNRAHILARNTIERVNGVLKGRFRCLHKDRVLHYDPVTASNIICTCVVLHNMCINHHLELDEEDVAEDDIPDPPIANVPQSTYHNSGQIIRRRLINTRFT